MRRVYIPKADGRQRPLGVTALEDKIVQRAAVEVLNAIYETDFLGFSYGFRPGRSQHQALDALYTGLLTRKVNWVLDLDIKGFFDGISHEWLVKFVEHRIADRRVVRLIQKWLNAGVLEDGKRIRVEEGTPQGGSASPLLANVYLHYVFDLWVQAWRRKRAHGDVIIVRFADDIVVGFTGKADADQFRAELTERMRKFNLELHPEKTRLLEFGPYAIDQPAEAWRRETGDVQLSWLYAHLREEEEQWTVYGVAADDPQKVAGEAERGESRTSATDARTHPGTGQVVASGGAWTHPLLRSAHEPTRAVRFFGSKWGGSGIARCRGAARTAASFGIACGVSSLAGCLCLPSVIPIPCVAWASSPKARAGCGKCRLSGSVEGVVSNHDSYSDLFLVKCDFETYVDVRLTLVLRNRGCSSSARSLRRLDGPRRHRAVRSGSELPRQWLHQDRPPR